MATTLALRTHQFIHLLASETRSERLAAWCRRLSVAMEAAHG
jgi:hypothetical protein